MMNGTPDPAIRAYGLTDVGKRRTDNQDQFLIGELQKSMLVQSSSLPVDQGTRLFGATRGQLLVVADGMGGHAAGRKASSVALDQLIAQLLNTVHWFLQVDHDSEEEFLVSLQDLLRQAHARVLSEAAIDSSQHGMGTTLTMAHVMWPKMYVVHAGDSRCYLIRDGKCGQLTKDHTLARQLVESGGLKPEEESTSRWSNVLWNVLGGSGSHELIAEVSRVDLLEDDTILLCSDGLTRYIDEKTLADVVVEGGCDVQGICHRLVGLANAAGGEDNITVVVAKPMEPATNSADAVVQTEVPLDTDLSENDEEMDLGGQLEKETLKTIREFDDQSTLPDHP